LFKVKIIGKVGYFGLREGFLGAVRVVFYVQEIVEDASPGAVITS